MQWSFPLHDRQIADYLSWVSSQGTSSKGKTDNCLVLQLTITSKGKQVSKVRPQQIPCRAYFVQHWARWGLWKAAVLQDGTKDNPAVHVKRKGNDVVKRASELAVLDKEVEFCTLRFCKAYWFLLVYLLQMLCAVHLHTINAKSLTSKT